MARIAESCRVPPEITGGTIGFIEFKGTFRHVVTINHSLLNVVLHE